jgi:ubiquinone/menaquinone biosynthesis C-methylase UbiE
VTATSEYIPALHWRSLNRIYDPCMRLTMREGTFRPALVERVRRASEPDDVLDVGCGTGTLALLLARALPDTRIVGLDADEDILARARAKVTEAAANVELVHAMADSLPFPDDSFDRVVSSLVFHHLAPSVKREALAEARRVLRPEGRLHLADWGRPQDPLMRLAFLSVRAVDGFDNTRAHARGELPALVSDAGFASVEVTEKLRTAFGTIEYIDARV